MGYPGKKGNTFNEKAEPAAAVIRTADAAAEDSLWAKVAREVHVVGAGLATGICSGAVEAKKEGWLTAVNMAGSLVLGAGLAYAQRRAGLFKLSAEVVGAVTSYNFASDIFSRRRLSGVGDALSDAWRSSRYLNRDVKLIADNCGRFAFDTAIMGISGVAGAKLGMHGLARCSSTAAAELELPNSSDYSPELTSGSEGIATGKHRTKFFADGGVLTEWTDGTRITVQPDGIKFAELGGNRSVIQFPDGHTITGLRSSARPGSFVTEYSDGTMLLEDNLGTAIMLPSGRWLAEVPVGSNCKPGVTKRIPDFRSAQIGDMKYDFASHGLSAKAAGELERIARGLHTKNIDMGGIQELFTFVRGYSADREAIGAWVHSSNDPKLLDLVDLGLNGAFPPGALRTDFVHGTVPNLNQQVLTGKLSGGYERGKAVLELQKLPKANGEPATIEHHLRKYKYRLDDITEAHTVSVFVPEEYARTLGLVRAHRAISSGASKIERSSDKYDQILHKLEERIARAIPPRSAPVSEYLRRALPEDLLFHYDRQPDRRLAKNLFVLDDFNGNAMADVCCSARWLRFFRAANNDELATTVAHETAHVLQLLKPETAHMFSIAAQFESSGYFLNEYAGTHIKENWAVHLGEGLLDQSLLRFFDTAHRAPLRSAVMGATLAERLASIPVSERSPLHSQYVARARYLQRRIVPRAISELMQDLVDNPVDADKRLILFNFLSAQS